MVEERIIDQRADQDLLHRYLAGRDVACPCCEYNLRDLAGDRCPECGDTLVLRVNMSGPRLAALIAGLVGLSSGAGLHGLLLVYGVVLVMTRSAYGFHQFFICNGVGFLISGGALILWLRNWRRLRRCSTSVQRRWALGCWLLTAANLTYFILAVK